MHCLHRVVPGFLAQCWGISHPFSASQLVVVDLDRGLPGGDAHFFSLHAPQSVADDFGRIAVHAACDLPAYEAFLGCPSFHALRPLRVNVFPGGFNWSLYVAQDKGLFHDAGVDVSVQGTTGSVAQKTDFAQGCCDLVMTAFDNIVAYVEGQGVAPIGP